MTEVVQIGKGTRKSHTTRLLELRRLEKENAELREQNQQLREGFLETAGKMNGLNNLLTLAVEFHHGNRMVLPKSLLVAIEKRDPSAFSVAIEDVNGQYIVSVKAQEELQALESGEGTNGSQSNRPDDAGCA